MGGSDTNEPLSSGTGFVHHAFVYDGWTLRDLGSLGGVASVARAINDRNEIVGWAWARSANGVYLSHATLWSQGAVTDLNGVTENAEDWILEAATAINNQG